MVTALVLSVSCAIFISALCSLLEAVLYSLPAGQVEVLAKKNPVAAKKLQDLKINIDQPVTAILTLNTLAHTIGASMAGAAAVAVFGERSLAWFPLVFSLLILLLSEILPKTVGLVYNKQLALYIATPLRWLVILLYPFIYLCRVFTYLVPNRNRKDRISAEELQAVAMLSRKSGAIGREQEEVITNILRLKETSVRQVMTPRTVTFSLDKHMNIREAARLTDKWRSHSRVPVYDENLDDVVGIVLTKDVFMAAVEDRKNLTLSQIMRPVHFVPETAPLNQVFLEFFERHHHLFIVVDEYGSVTGVISMEDIIEEIVGREIVDESDRTKSMRELARIRKKQSNVSVDRDRRVTPKAPDEHQW